MEAPGFAGAAPSYATPMMGMGGGYAGGSSSVVSPAAGGQIVLLGQGGQQAPLPKTLNEMEAELQALQKENFDLKMTIFYQKARFRSKDWLGGWTGGTRSDLLSDRTCASYVSAVRALPCHQIVCGTDVFIWSPPFIRTSSGGAGAAAGLRGPRGGGVAADGAAAGAGGGHDGPRVPHAGEGRPARRGMNVDRRVSVR